MMDFSRSPAVKCTEKW